MTTFESRDFLIEELRKIEDWENDQKDLWFWEKLGRLPFALLDRVTPKFAQDKIGTIIDELGKYIHTGGDYLVKEETVLKKFKQKGFTPKSEPFTLRDVQDIPLGKMDEIANVIRTSNTKLATVQGATTGIGGILTLSIDIPFLIGLSLKVLQEIAISYGYDPNDKAERVFIVKCLQFTSSDIVGKKAILEDLSSFQTENQKKQMLSQLQGWREVIFTYRDNFGWKKLFQMVPIAGIIFGAFLNRSMVGDVAEAGIMLYRKRRILERMNPSETSF
ncbi:EcsC family protein [Oceanobacillus senegalensis]|uniref:EcsC family protein n=1 Tax=Oceanobacillus senegalensis TaxID=1936063 RepID=UPI001181040B|nr:EcsC family protein [Oceanobacillus senegalensis]